MNTVALIGRLARDPEIREAQNENRTLIASFTLAVDRIGGEEADFISCRAFGKTAEFLEDWTKKGSKIGVTGRIQTGSYTNKDGQKVYTTDVIVDRVDFADSKKAEPAEREPEPEPERKRGSSRARR